MFRCVYVDSPQLALHQLWCLSKCVFREFICGKSFSFVFTAQWIIFHRFLDRVGLFYIHDPICRFIWGIRNVKINSASQRDAKSDHVRPWKINIDNKLQPLWLKNTIKHVSDVIFYRFVNLGIHINFIIRFNFEKMFYEMKGEAKQREKMRLLWKNEAENNGPKIIYIYLYYTMSKLHLLTLN